MEPARLNRTPHTGRLCIVKKPPLHARIRVGLTHTPADRWETDGGKRGGGKCCSVASIIRLFVRTFLYSRLPSKRLVSFSFVDASDGVEGEQAKRNVEERGRSRGRERRRETKFEGLTASSLSVLSVRYLFARSFDVFLLPSPVCVCSSDGVPLLVPHTSPRSRCPLTRSPFCFLSFSLSGKDAANEHARRRATRGLSGPLLC